MSSLDVLKTAGTHAPLKNLQEYLPLDQRSRRPSPERMIGGPRRSDHIVMKRQKRSIKALV